MSKDITIPDAVGEEMIKLQGTWKQIAYERDNVVEPLDEKGWEPQTTFRGNTFVVTLADGSTPIKGTYKLDPSRNPSTVDWTNTFGEDSGNTFPGIYCLQKDRFAFCAAYAGGKRPAEFRTRSGQVLRVSQREGQYQQAAEASRPTSGSNLCPSNGNDPHE